MPGSKRTGEQAFQSSIRLHFKSVSTVGVWTFDHVGIVPRMCCLVRWEHRASGQVSSNWSQNCRNSLRQFWAHLLLKILSLLTRRKSGRRRCMLLKSLSWSNSRYLMKERNWLSDTGQASPGSNGHGAMKQLFGTKVSADFTRSKHSIIGLKTRSCDCSLRRWRS